MKTLWRIYPHFLWREGKHSSPSEPPPWIKRVHCYTINSAAKGNFIVWLSLTRQIIYSSINSSISLFLKSFLYVYIWKKLNLLTEYKRRHLCFLIFKGCILSFIYTFMFILTCIIEATLYTFANSLFILSLPSLSPSLPSFFCVFK